MGLKWAASRDDDNDAIVSGAQADLKKATVQINRHLPRMADGATVQREHPGLDAVCAAPAANSFVDPVTEASVDGGYPPNCFILIFFVNFWLFCGKL